MSDRIRVPLDTPRIERRDAMTIAGIRERYAREGFDFAAFPAQERRMQDGLGGVTDRLGAAVYYVFWEMFADTDTFDHLVGVAIADGSRLPADFARVRLPAQRYAIFRRLVAADPADTARAIWHDWLPTSGYAPAGGPEFITVPGEHYDAATDTGALEIYVPLKD